MGQLWVILSKSMKVLYLTREYPPYVYGGAGVHVDHLSRAMAQLAQVEVRCFGDQEFDSQNGNLSVQGLHDWEEVLRSADPQLRKALSPVSVNLAAAALPTDADVVHCHTWYSMMGGLWIKLLYGLPLVITTHSLEPLRPWKAEQLGRGYQLSSWIERTAVTSADVVIAVSNGTRAEILESYSIPPEKIRVIHNGVDISIFRPGDSRPMLEKYGVSTDRPYILFVGRITRQKGVLHLIHAIRHFHPDLQTVLCAGAPDTAEIGQEMEDEVRRLQVERSGVHWISDVLSPEQLAQFYSGATLFVCPSIYEPFGIINLEAMACGCPVVASKVGGIPEAVEDNVTGLLVPFESKGAPDFQPRDPQQFSLDLAHAVNTLYKQGDRRRAMGEAGRKRVEKYFSWETIARQTLELYRNLSSNHNLQPLSV